MRFLSGGGEKKSQRPDLTFTSTCPVQIVMCSVGIQEEIGHFSVSSASLVWLNLYGTLAASVYKHAHISMHAQLSHCLGGKGKARAWLYHCQSTKKKIKKNWRSHSKSQEPSAHQHTKVGWCVTVWTQKPFSPPFSQHTLLTCVKGWEHTILSKMDVAAWDQSTHLLFVQLFSFPFFQSPEAWRRQGALKMFCKCPNSRCGRSKSKQRELKHMYVCWNRSEAAQMGRQKLAACVEDDIRPPTIQLSRSDHMRRIQSPFHLLRFTLPNYPWLLILHPSL